MNQVVKKPRLLRSGIVTASATFLSRILGMVRDIAVATHIAVYMILDLIFHTCLIILPIM